MSNSRITSQVLISVLTFYAMAQVSMLWSGRFDPAKPRAPRFGLKIRGAVARIAVQLTSLITAWVTSLLMMHTVASSKWPQTATLIVTTHCIFVISVCTFLLVTSVSLLWSGRFDPAKPVALRLGLRSTMVAVALIALQVAALKSCVQITTLRSEYSRKAFRHSLRAESRRMVARLHLEHSVDYPSDTVRQREVKDYFRAMAKADLEAAAYDDALHQKYEQAAQSPSHPVAPDPPPPKGPKAPPGWERLESDLFEPID
jgi:hypothetical protein